MRFAASLVLAVALVVVVAPPGAAQEASSSVVVVKVDGSVDRTVAGYLRDAIDDAEATGSTVVLQLDTAGTLDQDGVSLARTIHEASVPVVAWVGPSPAKAQGAGLLFLYAASLAAVAPGVGVGPLDPLDLAGGEPAPAAQVRQLATSWATEFERALPLTFPSEAVPAQAALDGNIAELAAASIPDLLDRLDGRLLRTVSGSVTLRTKIARAEGEEPVDIKFVDLGPVDRVLHAASSPTWIYVLLVLGLAALAFELTQPAFGFAGFGGIAMLALSVYGLTVVPFSALGLGLLFGGMASLTLDVRIRRLGVLTALGLAAFVSGSLLAFATVSDRIDLSPWLVGSFAVAALLYWGFGLTVAVQSRDRISSTQRGLIGLVGETRGELGPEGPVYVKGALWRGRSVDGPIPSGTRVRVRAVDGLVLRVQPEPDPDERPPAGAEDAASTGDGSSDA